MDYQEEQTQELEVLESIYPDELTVINGKYPTIQFQISVKVEPQLDDPSSLTREHSMLVNFQLPETYPDEAPVIGIEAVEESLVDEDDEDGDDDDNEKDEPELDDHGNRIVGKLRSLPDSIHFDGFIPELKVQLEEQIESDMLLGMQMCFTLVASIKDLCETWFVDELAKLEKQHELEMQAREKEEQRKFQGTKVTPASFVEWRRKFIKELKLDQRNDLRKQTAHNGRLTGRQIFEQGLAGEIDEDAEDEDENLTEVTDKLKNQPIA